MADYRVSGFGVLKIFTVMSALLIHAVHSESSKIQEDLFTSPDETKDVIVTFGTAEEIKGIVHQLTTSYSYSPKEERIYAMYQAMSSYSTKCQSSAQSYLDSASYTYHHMWSSNTMIIRNADHACAKVLADMSDVTSIQEDSTHPLIDPVPINGAVEVLESVENVLGGFSIGTTWGLSVMRVPEAWRYNPNAYTSYGYGKKLKTGSGITVSNIDSGVNADHVALRDNYRGYAGWHDGYNLTDTPEDLMGHGTHTMGTICGHGGIGVAPGAQWIACRGCLIESCRVSALLNCCQWILCPHDTNKGAPESYRDCSTVPDLVSNSWGGGQGDKTFERCALALRAAGIIPIFAIGNEGPNCTTASSPGDLENVIGVGATNSNDELAWFSSRGPTVEGGLKPDVSAPGMAITSSWFSNETAFVTISGTSMSTPHVAGLIALMLERCRLPYKTVLSILQNTADREGLGETTKVCGGTKSDQFPNNFYGYGRVNALEAIKKVGQICHLNRNYNSNYDNHNNIPYYHGGGSRTYDSNPHAFRHNAQRYGTGNNDGHGYTPYRKNYYRYYLNH